MERKLITLIALLAVTLTFAQYSHNRVYSTFDNLPLEKADTFNNGADLSNGFTHYNRYWNNNYNSMWSSWNGWALSNMKDTITAGFGNQYSAITGSGVSATPNYMVSNGNGAFIKLDVPQRISGAYFTNATYTVRDMEQGSGFSKKFGGDDGNDPDFLRIIISSYLKNAFVDSTIFYLADYRFEDNTQDYIVKDWTFVDFNNDEAQDFEIDSISFRYEGSDTAGGWLNTPAYFCMDDFNAVSSFNIGQQQYDVLSQLDMTDTFYNGSDEAGGISDAYLFFPNSYNSDWGSWSGWSYSGMLDDTTAGYLNQYSCINKTYKNFYVSNGQGAEIRAPYFGDRKNPLFKTASPAPWPIGIRVTNSTYAALDMEQGSGFSKKFGGADGNDPDYFRLLVNYVDASNEVLKVDTVYLADYRFADNSKDYIQKDWISIKFPHWDSDFFFHKLVFNLESSDTSSFGINTPAAFCLSYEFNISNVEQNTNATNFNMYPNPTTGVLNFESKDLITNVDIISLDGRVVTQMSTGVSSRMFSVNTADLSPGVYFARVTTSNGIASKRFIKQ